MLEDVEELLLRLGTQHLDARLAEVGNALEDGRGGQMATGVENGTLLDGEVAVAGLTGEAYALDVDAQLLLEDVDFLVERQGLATENPGAAEGGTTYHDGIDTIAVEGKVGLVERGDIAVAYNRNMYARVALHLANEGPVGLTGVHLRACAAMNGKCLYATVLQLLGQLGNDELLMVPAKACLHGDGQTDGLDHLLRNLQQLGNVLEHACTSALAGHLLDGAAEVEVDEVRACLLHNLGCLDHRVDVATVDLYAHRPFVVADGQLADGGVDIADEGLGGDELRVDHCCAKALTKHAEADVRDVLHGRQEQGAFAEFYISNLHIVDISTVLDRSTCFDMST